MFHYTRLKKKNKIRMKMALCRSDKREESHEIDQRDLGEGGERERLCERNKEKVLEKKIHRTRMSLEK